MDADSTYWHFLCGLGVFGFGMALTSTPSTTAIVASLPRAKQGVASAMNDVSRELGSALGIAILGSLFSSGYRAAIDGTTAALPPEAAHTVGESAGAGLAVASQLGEAGHDLADAVHGAFAMGLGDAMTAGALIAVVAAGFTVWRGPRREHVRASSPTSTRQARSSSAATVADEDVPTVDARWAPEPAHGIQFGDAGPCARTDRRGKLRRATALPVPGSKLRGLIAILALEAGSTVTTQRLIDALWGDQPVKARTPCRCSCRSSAEHRRRGRDADVITQPSGYQLDVDRDEVDALRFEALLADASSESG